MIGRMAKLADDQREAAIILVAKLKIVGMRRCIFDIADERQRRQWRGVEDLENLAI